MKNNNQALNTQELIALVQESLITAAKKAEQLAKNTNTPFISEEVTKVDVVSKPCSSHQK